MFVIVFFSFCDKSASHASSIKLYISALTCLLDGKRKRKRKRRRKKSFSEKSSASRGCPTISGFCVCKTTSLSLSVFICHSVFVLFAHRSSVETTGANDTKSSEFDFQSG